MIEKNAKEGKGLKSKSGIKYQSIKEIRHKSQSLSKSKCKTQSSEC